MPQTNFENYTSVFDQKIGFGARPALLLIDFVEAYFNQACNLYANVDHVLAAAIRVRSAARQAGIAIIYTNVTYHETMMDSGVFGRKAAPIANLKRGSKFAEWPDEFRPASNELVVTKQYPSAFFGTSLASTLVSARIDSVILTGLTTSGCVRASCVDACSHGFVTSVVRDACGDRAEGPHEANLFDMDAKYADVVSETEIIDYLSSLSR